MMGTASPRTHKPKFVNESLGKYFEVLKFLNFDDALHKLGKFGH